MSVFMKKPAEKIALAQGTSRQKRPNFFRRNAAKLIIGTAAVLVLVATTREPCNFIYHAISSYKANREWREAPIVNWEDTADVNHMFGSIGMKIPGNAGGKRYVVSDIQPDAWNGSRIVFSSFRKDIAVSEWDVYAALAKFLNTEEGPAAFCEHYLQARLDSAYRTVGLEGMALRLTEGMKKEIGARFDGVKLSDEMLFHPWDSFVFPNVSGYTAHLGSYWDKEHELLHIASGVCYDNGTGGSWIKRAIKWGERIANLAVHRAMGAKYERTQGLGKNDPAWGFEEAMTSLVCGDGSYWVFAVPLKNSLKSLAPQERKERMDEMVLSWLNLSSEQQNTECLVFFQCALERYALE